MTTQAKRTPGPWYFEELEARPDGCGYIRTPHDNLEIAHHGDMGRSRGENLANAAVFIRLENAEAKVREALEMAANELSYAASCLEDAGWPNAASHLRRKEAEVTAALALLDGEGNGTQ